MARVLGIGVAEDSKGSNCAYVTTNDTGAE